MLRRARFVVFSLAIFLPTLAAADPSSSDSRRTPHAAPTLRALGPFAEKILAPSTGIISALVTIPPGTTAAALGIREVAPGIGMVSGSSSSLLAFSAKHPGVHMEVATPTKPLLNTAVQWTNQNLVRGTNTGADVVVGVADTGLDVSHPDFIDAQGHSRVAWMLDLSLPPNGKYPDIENAFGIRDDQTKQLVFGAVYSALDIDALRASGSPLPGDEVGHGTHVTGIAAGNGGGTKQTIYRGFAEGATIVFARISGPGSGSFEEGALINGVRFLFDRADALRKPVVVNLSLGSEIGPHDGTTSWEGVLASFVGPTHPGHALVVAAGNSGSVVENPTHQSVYVAQGTRTRVPIVTDQSTGHGGAQVWLTMRAGAKISVGLEGPDGEWIAPVAPGNENGHNASGYNSGVVNGVTSDGTGGSAPGQTGSLSDTPYAIVLWSGTWPVGTYNVTLEGSGTVELYVNGTDASASVEAVHFAGGVREGTVNLPASHPGLIAVGCTINKPGWTSIYSDPLGIRVPLVDTVGGYPSDLPARNALPGEVCYFSSAGPNVNGVPKPEIAAPGGVVISSMASQAKPGTPGSIFTAPCPDPKNGGPNDPRCFQVDATHAVASGTSMSSPMVAGAIALLLERDPTLTQDKITALLQAGAHTFVTHVAPPKPNPSPSLVDVGYVADPFQDQGGVGELDVQGALDALDQMQNPKLVLPSRAKSWLTLSSDYVAADESMPLVVLVELRTADGAHRADMFDPSRLAMVVSIDGAVQSPPPVVKVAPGLWKTTIQVPSGLGGSTLSVGATFDGEEIAAPKSVPIGTDFWNADYPSRVKGGCSAAANVTNDSRAISFSFGALAFALALARSRRRARHSD